MAGAPAMAAILRSGKFLRLFSGVARNLAATGGKSDENGLVPSSSSSSGGLVNCENFLGQANFSIQNVLPYLGVSDSGHAEDRYPTRLLSSPNRNLGRVSRSEIDLMIEEIRNSEIDMKNINLLSSQALLAIRLCGTVLDQEMQKERSSLVSRIWSLLLEKGLPITVVHYNALLRVHLENKHKFDPEEVVSDMSGRGLVPDRETYQCLISRYCQEGNIEGASRVLQVMKQKGFKVNENIFNSLIIGHSENSDMARAQGILKVMRQWGLTPSTETYLTLACSYARHGEISNMEKVISECSSQNLSFKDGDFLEILYVLCEHNLKENVGRILAALHPETEEFGCLASHMVVRLVNAGHDDVAYNLVQFTVENSAEESGKLISTEFLEQLVRVNTTVVKLLWFLKDMSDRKIHTGGGLENLVDVAVRERNVRLALRLGDILQAEGGRVSKKQYRKILGLVKRSVVNSAEPVGMASAAGVISCETADRGVGSSEPGRSTGDINDVVAGCVRLGSVSGQLSSEVLKKFVFPLLDTWPELTIAQLEEFGLGRADSVTPMIEFLVGQGKLESAATVAGIFSEHVDPKLKFLTSASHALSGENQFTTNHDTQHKEATSTRADSQEEGKIAQTSDTAAVQPNDEKATLACVVEQLSADNRFGDLEIMLETRAEGREVIYINLLKLYARHSLIDRAIGLSRRLREEQIVLPEFYEILGELIESQYSREGSSCTRNDEVVSPGATPAAEQPPHQGWYQAYQYHPYYNQFLPVPTPVALPCLPPGSDPGFQQYHYYPAGQLQQSAYMSPSILTSPLSDDGGSTPQLPSNGSCYEPSIASSDLTASANFTMSSPDTLGNVFIPGEPFYPSSTATPSTCSTPSPLDQAYLHRRLKRAVASGDAVEGLSIHSALEASGKVVNVTESSALIEQLVRAELTGEATRITRSMLERNTHPLPKIFRFLLNKLATSGSVEDMLDIGDHLSTRVKKDVSYDNRLCNAYLSAGRGAEFLDTLVRDLEVAVQKNDPEMLTLIQERFPRGGAMGLLDNHPELLDKFTFLAEEFAKTGYVAPMNVLWTYHLIHNNIDLADQIWQTYVRSSNQIMFQKVCQVARATGNLNLAFGLVNNLSQAEQVTPGARGIAYSCLLDCLCAAEDHAAGYSVLQDALSQGVQLEDVNRTALVRLKAGLEELGQSFPYTIPPKNSRRDQERSLSPVDWNEM